MRPPWAILILAGLTLVGAAMAQGPAAATTELYVSSDPAGASCVVGGVPRGPTPVTISGLPAGETLVILNRPGYREARRTVSLTAGTRRTLDVPMEPLRGLVLIHATPPGTLVTLNGAERGRAPLLLGEIPFGTHRLRFQAQGHLDLEQELIIDSRIPVRVDAALRPSTATLEIHSQPEGATVRVDQLDRGQTPVIVDRIPAGTRSLSLHMDGYEPSTRELALPPGQYERLDVALVPIAARLTVLAPGGPAAVYLDNQLSGETPLTLDGIPPGSYRLRVEREGYASGSRTITLELAQSQVEEFRLERDSGILEVTTEPAGVTVYLDGREVGITTFDTNATDRVSLPLRLPHVPQGPRMLQLSITGYFSQNIPIEIRTGETLTLHRALQRRFIPNYEIETAASLDRGVLLERDKQGNIRLEVRPGVIKTIRRQDVIRGRPLLETDLTPMESSGADVPPPGSPAR